MLQINKQTKYKIFRNTVVFKLRTYVIHLTPVYVSLFGTSHGAFSIYQLMIENTN